MAVPNPSTNSAPSGEIKPAAASPVPYMAGFGKYSPKTIAERSLPAIPRAMPLSASKREIAAPNIPRTVSPANTLPASCAAQYSGISR